MIVYTLYKDGLHHGYMVTNAEEVYNALEKSYGHDLAMDAQCWCEIASVGECYYGRGFEIEVEDIDL